MVAKIDVDTPKIYEQIKKLMRLKIGKTLKTASHNLKFIDSYQKKKWMHCVHFLLSIVDSSDIQT